jgi:hypothetical protein
VVFENIWQVNVDGITKWFVYVLHATPSLKGVAACHPLEPGTHESSCEGFVSFATRQSIFFWLKGYETRGRIVIEFYTVLFSVVFGSNRD